jgi:hypothetical protein
MRASAVSPSKPGGILEGRRGTRGPQPSSTSQTTALEKDLRRIKGENARLQQKLRQAELIIDLQKKVSELFGIALPVIQSGESDDSGETF